MIPVRECADSQLELGAYVLGTIGPADRARVEGHLAGCQDCRNELADLAGLPALLSAAARRDAAVLAGDGVPALPCGKRVRVLPADGAQEDEEPAADPSRDLLAALLDLVARRRRFWRRAAAFTLAAAVAVAAVLVLGGGRLP